MAEKEFGLFDRLRSAREVKMLQCELADALTQVQLKEGKIQELQRMLVSLQESEIEESIAVQEETQCSLPHTDPADPPEVLRLSALLREREEEGVGLHLACIEKEQEAASLQSRAEHAEEMVRALQQELNMQQSLGNDQEAVIDTLKNENQSLRMQLVRLENTLEQREAEAAQQEQHSQNLRVLQESKAALEHIIIQNQKLRRGHSDEEEGAVRQLLQGEVAALLEEKDRMKKTINNYEWKLFCLETELDLSNKEKKQYKYVCDKHEARLADFEATNKQNTIKIFSLQEEVRALEEENRFYQAEVSHYHRTLEQCKNQLQQAEEREREREAEGEAVKELEYRVREKDEELKEIANYLKEKLSETHEARLKCSQLQKALQEAQRKIQKGEMEVYQLEQCIFDHQEIMQKQIVRIDETTKQNDFLNNKINELNLLSILRTKEFEEKFSAAQSALTEKAQKNNDLSVELIEKDAQLKTYVEREAQFNERLELTQQQLKKSQQYSKVVLQQLADVKHQNDRMRYMLEETQVRVEHLQMLSSTKDKEIDKLVSKLNTLEGSLKEKDKIVQFLQVELKAAKADFKDTRLALRRREEELEELKEVMAVNEEKIKILKKESVDNIETELTNQYEIEQLKKKISELQSQKQTLSAKHFTSILTNLRFSNAIKELQQAGKATATAIISRLTNPPEETEAFEILDDDFEPLGDRQERERKEILEKLDEFCNQIDQICQDCTHKPDLE